MYGGSGKLGRGGGGGKRNIHAPPINRNSAATSGGRLSSGGGASAVTRGRDGGGESSSGPTSSLQAEETFSLVTRNPLNFAMALRLVPDLVEEINRVEAMGGTARIKFDYNANNSGGNVITVGDKNFNFTWSEEMGELCDIYEERKNGEDGNGLLIESGGTWRKLNVQRVLDESTKKHVKMRSEEAERKNKQRKSIVLDHQNSSMKNQMKALAAAESNSWRMPFKRKEPPFKKSKPEAYPGGPPKSVYKSSLSAPNPSKNRSSTGSSLSSHTEQYGAPAHTSGSSNPMKGNAIVSDATPSQASSKATSLDKEMSSRMANNTVLNKPVQNQNVDAKHFDLRSFIVSLLIEHHTEGMSLKALEKAIGEAMPNSIQKIQPILKQIATFKAPGRYYLKPGVTENFKKTSSESGSSPEIVCNQSPATNNFGRLPDQNPNFSSRTPINELEEQAQLNSMCGNASDTEEKIDIPLNSPDHSNGKKVSDDSEGQAGSSSDGGSDSDSESNSSDSGSDSESNSRGKRSPVGSRSGSSSDSESDVSSSSKQAPDEDVDIMTSDDGKEPESEPLSKSPTQSRPLDVELLDIGHYEKQDDWVSDVVEIENDNPEDDLETERATCNYLFSNEEGEDMKPSSPNHYKYYENQGYDSVVKDGFEHGEPDSCTRSSKGKSKRLSNERHSVDMADRSKRLKDTSLSQPFSRTITSLFGESPQNSSPDELLKSSLEAPINQMSIRDASHGNCDNLQVDFNQGIQSGSFSESRVPGQRSSDVVGRAEVHSNGKRLGKQDGLGCGVEESERGLQTSGRLWTHNPINMETLHEDGDTGDKETIPAESISRKPKIMVKATDAGRHSKIQTSYSPKDSNANTVDRSLVTNGQDNKLQRELSELELGEFREPLPDEIPGPKKQFEKKVKKHRQSEKKSADSDCWNSDLNRGKPSKKITPGSRKLSPQNSETVVSGIPDGSSKRKPSENNVSDPSKPQLRETRNLPQQHQPSAGPTEFVTNHNKIPEISKIRNAEPETQRTNSEANGYKKVAVNATEQQHGLKRTAVSQSMNEFKKQEPNMIGSSNDRPKDTFLVGGNNGIQKRRESFSDEKNCPYAKYEKEEPELKSPIKDLSQYKEYVKEYQEKYESYCSLNNILQSYRDEFSKLGNELETCRGRDNKRYQDILEQIRSSFRQCGEKHKQFKKIFIVLHEELRHLKQRIKDFAASCTRD
ncbi:uncharacterized protein [Henckelia pumila]|uniref:uncharacterized protein isoform X2 n=1 Tax=Henckelia pumila TaxID=405737 RepID=UPI003C6DDB46